MAVTDLDHGVRVLSEQVPGVRSVSAGIWVRHGSAHEGAAARGASHLLEHMVFKGTARRSARELALSLEALGGSLDAYTSREHTSYQARVLDAHLPEALDVLADLVVGPVLRDEDFALEREVVLEEIAQVEDTPDDLVFELHGAALWEGHPYGESILGTPDSVRAIDGDGLRALHATAYRARNVVVAAAGHVEHDDLVRRVDEHLGALAPGEPTAPVSVPAEPGPTGDRRVARDTAQTHVVFGARAPRHSDPRRYPLVLLSTALGGGMSSRLFQRVREELGLCYSIFTYQSFYARGGVAGVYVGTRPGTEADAVEAVREELARVAAAGLPDAELALTKQQLKGQITLSMESTGARLYRLTSSTLHDEPYRTLDEVLDRIDAVSPDEVRAAARDVFDPDRMLVLRLGPA